MAARITWYVVGRYVRDGRSVFQPAIEFHTKREAVRYVLGHKISKEEAAAKGIGRSHDIDRVGHTFYFVPRGA